MMMNTARRVLARWVDDPRRTMSDHVSSEQHGAVRVVTIDDSKANALSFEIIAAIEAELDAAEADDATRAMVIAGRPGMFCAGFDLGVMRSGDPSAVVSLVAAGGALVTRFYGASIPVVGAATGHALAAGALMLLGCDHRVGADAAVKIGLNEVAIGMVLPDWAFAIAEDRLAITHLQSAVANAHVYDGVGAVAAGFLDEAVEPERVVEVAIERATALTELHPGAYVGTIKVLRSSVIERMQAPDAGSIIVD